ncbi:MAG: hypothetical protein ABEJ99_04905 [Candidatus Nanohaloarchaea archaeon]
MFVELWVIAGVLTAMVQSARSYLQKVLVEDVSGIELSFVKSLYTALVLLPVAVF